MNYCEKLDLVKKKVGILVAAEKGATFERVIELIVQEWEKIRGKVTMAELKPLACPFCGETESLFVEKAGGWENDFYVHCYGCSTFGPSGNDKEQAISAWNKRSK